MSRVFAYGSLMGDAVLARYPVRPARLAGYHRAFLHESRQRWGRPEAARLLLERGARTNFPDDLPWATPLAWARKKGHAEVERMLLEAGATA